MSFDKWKYLVVSSCLVIAPMPVGAQAAEPMTYKADILQTEITDDREHDGHDEDHEEETADGTRISDKAAKRAGITLREAQGATINHTVPLTGRIGLNENTTVNLRARFPGVVRNVNVALGQRVRAGDVLATVESNESLRTYDIKAPSAGVVLARDTNPGDIAGDNVLFRIADLSNVWAEFHVFSKDMPSIIQGQQIKIHTLDERHQTDAVLDLLLPTVDRLSQTVIALSVLPNSDGFWRPGMIVEGDVTVATRDASVAVPISAIQIIEDHTVVFVRENDTYTAQPVRLGLSDDRMVEVVEGLPAGTQYVASGSFVVKADIGKNTAKHSH